MSDLRPANEVAVRRRQSRITLGIVGCDASRRLFRAQDGVEKSLDAARKSAYATFLHSFGDEAGASFAAFTRPRAAERVAIQRATPEYFGLTFFALSDGHERVARTIEFALLNGHRPLTRGDGTGDLFAVARQAERGWSSGFSFFPGLELCRPLPLDTGRGRQRRQQQK